MTNNPLSTSQRIKRNLPLEVWQSRDGSWTWNVWKKYQQDDDKPFARWFCTVVTPMTGSHGDMGDVYVKDIKSNAVLVSRDPNVPPPASPKPRGPSPKSVLGQIFRKAEEMGYMKKNPSPLPKGYGLDFTARLSHHLQHNHYPPVHLVFLDVAKLAIHHAGDAQEGDRKALSAVLKMPNGKSLTVQSIMDQLHLWEFLGENPKKTLKYVPPKKGEPKELCERCGRRVPRSAMYEEGICKDCRAQGESMMGSNPPRYDIRGRGGVSEDPSYDVRRNGVTIENFPTERSAVAHLKRIQNPRTNYYVKDFGWGEEGLVTVSVYVEPNWSVSRIFEAMRLAYRHETHSDIDESPKGLVKEVNPITNDIYLTRGKNTLFILYKKPNKNPRVDNLGKNVDEWHDKAVGEGTSTFDVCSSCASVLAKRPHAFDKKLKPYQYGEPSGDLGRGGDVEHPPYEETDYECAVCGKPLTEHSNPCHGRGNPGSPEEKLREALRYKDMKEMQDSTFEIVHRPGNKPWNVVLPFVLIRVYPEYPTGRKIQVRLSSLKTKAMALKELKDAEQRQKNWLKNFYKLAGPVSMTDAEAREILVPPFGKIYQQENPSGNLLSASETIPVIGDIVYGRGKNTTIVAVIKQIKSSHPQFKYDWIVHVKTQDLPAVWSAEVRWNPMQRIWEIINFLAMIRIQPVRNPTSVRDLQKELRVVQAQLKLYKKGSDLHRLLSRKAQGIESAIRAVERPARIVRDPSSGETYEANYTPRWEKLGN